MIVYDYGDYVAMMHVQEEMEKQQAYFEHLEKKEAMEQMMQSVTEKRVTVFHCAKVRTYVRTYAQCMYIHVNQSVRVCVCVHVFSLEFWNRRVWVVESEN